MQLRMPSRSSKQAKEKERLFSLILEHEYVPRAEVLSKEEAREVLKRLNAQPWQLPWIRASDPLVKALKARPGNIIKIVRKSPTAGEVVAYRFVVPG